MTNFFAWLQTAISKPDLASWLQAFAAMVALGISVWAALRAGAVERKRDRLQSYGIAVAIYPEILQMEVILENTRKHFDQLVQDFGGRLVGQNIAASIVNGQIALPAMLDRNVDRLFMLGAIPGASCLQLGNVLSQYNSLVEAIAARTTMLNANQWKEGIGHLKQHLDLLGGVVAKCKHEVAPLHDAFG
jgi:hypothetical protein